MLKLSKVRGANTIYRFEYSEGAKSVVWDVNGTDVDLDSLRDVVDVVSGYKHHQPATHDMDGEELLSRIQQTYFHPPLFEVDNPGSAAADKAAREEEMRLRNMGSALGKGINLGPEDIPVFNGEADDTLPPVDWGRA